MTHKIRTIRIDGNIAFVPLTKGYEAIIDASDVPLVAMWHWCVAVRPHAIYAQRSQKINGRQKTISLHRSILSPSNNLYIDHINGNGLDNRRVNLRFATNSQNQHNSKIRIDNTSKVKGVTFHMRDKKWTARIRLDNKQHNLGSFATPEAAAAVVAHARAKMHGAFARDA